MVLLSIVIILHLNIQNKLMIQSTGVLEIIQKPRGGADGVTSGEVASNVAGSKLVMHGYAGVAAFTPYRSVILFEA